ncbi:ABC transporter ATP-binding protein [Anaerosacchariphilus polymeriproducens]|uniref:ABC transporter ATP-binding protein n=1 Tax=Anaerosacchariphilus polymeriproducens TaxID=1812858 RepID=A0A371ATX4_9FIRM|nr:ABC transporter ATP-binding protein [Anaerosacchariphilus polymeriproducens]RDU23015.1 ABC transporter ATP-binding protein [Anaerosacchariphilus polymeriproducens]
MKEFRKILAKTKVSILFVIVLLIIQAACDLSLPAYTSNIVNVGIQQGGIDSLVPDAIRKSEMDKVLLFTKKEQEDILQYYKFCSKENLSKEKFSSYKSKYPIIEKEGIYVLKSNLAKEEKNKIEAKLKTPMLITYMLSADISQLSGKNSEKENGDAMKNSFLQSIPEGTDVFAVITKMPEENINELVKEFEKKFDSLGSSITKQFGISYLKGEYNAINMDVKSIQIKYIVFTGLKMLLVALLAMGTTILVTLLGAKIGTKVSKDLRSSVFSKVLHFSNQELNKFSTSSLITRSTNDIQQIQMLLVMMARMIVYAPIIGIGALIKVTRTGSDMFWVIGVAVGAMLLLILILMQVAMPKFKQVQQLVDKVNQVAREILTGLPVIRAFNTERYEEKRFDGANRDLTKVNLFVNRVMMFMMPTMMFIMNGISILILWVGADSVNKGSMQVGDIMAFIQYTIQIIMAFLMLSLMSIILPRAIVSAKRICEVLDTEATILDPDDTKSFDNRDRGYVEFKEVSFRYPKATENVLNHISFTAKPGETTAIIGSTGSGKSTLINLIPRLYDVTEGMITVNGIDIREISQHNLREKIGFAPQKALLFSGTIESNIAYGKDNISDEEIQKAARIAQASDFIDEKPEKYKDSIAQNGDNVSGGQKQRLAIARALAKDADIFIFDDSFSALDYKTDRILRQTLKNELNDRTIIIVAQRISTVINADQIVVLDEGNIVGMGKHKDLIESCEVYRDIAYSQLSEEELMQGGGVIA